MKILSVVIALLMSTALLAKKDQNGDGLYAKVITDKGDILLQLEFEKVPITVANFVGLAEGRLAYDTVEITKPFFDSLKFHRVMANFMIQGGDPLGNGMGNPGYRFPDEFDSTLTHDRAGILSMANSGPNTNGSQFFITHKDTPWLNGKHAVFGHVVTGQDVVDKIEQDDYILHVEIIRVGKKAKKFKAHKVFPKAIEAKEEALRIERESINKVFYDEMIVKFPNAKQTESGLMYEILEEGNGIKPVSGATVDVHYTGMFVDGKVFDSSKKRNKSFRVVVDKSHVIKGWHEGIKLCDIEGKIKLILPSSLAYGKSGRGSIPPNATLVFDIDVLASSQPQEIKE